MKKIALMGAALLFSVGASANSTLTVGEFSKGNINNWEPREFSGKTQYQIVKEGNNTILKANSNSSASGLGRKIRVDLTKTPVLNWTWRVDKKLTGLNEQSKSGDDYAARVYVIIDGGIFPWRSKAVNYVWSSNQARGTSWGNAFLPKNAKMTAVRGTQDKVGGWVREKRNVREDFKRLYGINVTHIDGVAIMTDTDNSEGQASAAYGNIFFTAK